MEVLEEDRDTTEEGREGGGGACVACFACSLLHPSTKVPYGLLTY